MRIYDRENARSVTLRRYDRKTELSAEYTNNPYGRKYTYTKAKHWQRADAKKLKS